MKKNREAYREIIATIGITLMVGGMTPNSRADDGRGFADKSKFLRIDVPGAAGVTESFGINPQSDIVGTYFAVSNNNTITLGFLLRKGTFTNIDVDVPGALEGSTNAFAINPQGNVVGFYSDTNFVPHGFLLRKGTFTTIDPPSSTFTALLGINPEGDIVGFYAGSSVGS